LTQKTDVDEVLEFGPFRLLPARQLLMRDGRQVPLGGRAFDILLTLVARSPQVVDKNVLMERVWPGIAVEDANLRVQMIAVRRALGDGQEDRRYIKTVQGRGYCFVAPVTRSEGGTDVPLQADFGRSPRTNLPQYLSRAVGRDGEMEEVQEHLHNTRLVTLIGPGGVGKTRLAVELGWRLLGEYPGGVWLVDLAPLTEPAAVASATATVIGAVLAGKGAAVEAIAMVLGDKPRLLIFDNCEYLIEAAAELIKVLLDRAPSLTVLATSQEALRIPSEQLYPVHPLAVPPSGSIEITGFGAVDLFVDRVRSSDATFDVHRGVADDVAEICRRLDGLPLALEMAAARLRLLGVRGLRAGLDDRLKFLKGAPRSGGTRYESLRAVLEWSFGLLEPHDQHLFRCLAVFPGSFSLDGAVAVSGKDETDRWEVLDAVGRLVEKSLIMVEGRDPVRYRLLETLRLFAAEGLHASGESEDIRERHAWHLATTLRRASLAWETMPDIDWIALYLPELDNLRTALDWALAAPERSQTALKLGAPGIHLLHVLDLIAEAQHYSERLVPLIDRNTPAAVEAALLLEASGVWENAIHQAPMAYAERAVQLYRALDDRPRLSAALRSASVFYMREQRIAEARSAIDEAWKLIAHGGVGKTRLNLLHSSALVTYNIGEHGRSRSYQLQVLDMARTLKSVTEATCLTNLALTEYLAGDVAGAIERGKEAISLSRRTPGQRRLGFALMSQAAFLLAEGETAEARSLVEEAFPGFVARDETACWALQICAVLSAFEGRLNEAARLIGFIDAERMRTGQPLGIQEQRLYGELSSRLGQKFSVDELVSLKADGERWATTEAIAFVQNVILRTHPPASCA